MVTYRFFKSLFIVLCSLSICFAATGQPRACTGIEVKTTDGSVIFARTMEFGAELKSDLMFFPKGQNFSTELGKDLKGKSWQNSHAYIGMTMMGTNHLVEGLNDSGLYIGGFFFPGFAKYPPVDPAKAAESITPQTLGDFLLGNCASVDQVRQTLQKVGVVAAPFPAMGEGYVAPMHAIALDSTGQAIVIEYVGGKLHLYDNPVGVITNAPTFDWHLINLRNYINLSAINVPKLDIKGLRIKATGQGSGMLGLPGDYTPPSRFIRAAVLRLSAMPVKTAVQGVNLAWHLINNIDIAVGTARDVEADGKVEYDYTQWTTVYDLTNKQVYFRTYDDINIRKVDMKLLDPQGKRPVKIPVHGMVGQIPDVTNTAN